MCMLAAMAVNAQEATYKYDFGGGIGMSGYIGEANSSSIFKHPGFTAEVGARYIPNVRWALRGLFSVTTLSGNTADMSNYLPGGQQFSFSSMVYSLEARAEFNFMPYGIGETYKRLSRWTPYLGVGMGINLASSGGYTAVAPEVPMIVGIKYKVQPRLNLALEFSMTKVFGDNVDGKELVDLTGIQTSFVKNTDWYSRITLGITFEFGERCATCHYVD